VEWSSKHVSGRSYLDETPRVHHRDPVGDAAGRGQVVGDQQHRAALGDEAAELVEQRVDQWRVQADGATGSGTCLLPSVTALVSLLRSNGNWGVGVHEVQIEVVLLSVSDDEQLRWRVACGDLPAGCRPDARARELAGLGADVPTATVVHSTSWRPTPGGLILTYAVLPDPAPAENIVHAIPAEAKVVCSTDAAAPTPAAVAIEHVLAHALRHLSLVARTTPAVVAAVDEHPRLWHAVVVHTPDVAGQLVGS
jgi:hypothetical protein